MIDYEELLELMQSRRSIRQFSGRAVAREDIARLIEAARWAPSNHNRQPWRFIVLDDPNRIQALARDVTHALSARLKSLPQVAGAYLGEFATHAISFAQAPALLVVLHKQPVSLASALLDGVHNPELVSGEPLSVAMAVQNLLLAAHALELGTCVLTAPLVVPDSVTHSVTLPPGFDITCLVAVGYPAESPAPPRRKSLEQIVEFGDDGSRIDK
jgi:coenzyme F420-0:L-glutamate ligase / coenzyme F420-1:gamma-L-glutamate ligase